MLNCKIYNVIFRLKALNNSNYRLKMSMASEDVKQIKTTLSQILQNQTAMMAQIVLMNKQTNIMPTSPMNSAMTQSFLEGLKSKFSGASKKLLCTPSAKPLTVGPPKRKAELPLDNLTNTTAIANKHHRSLSQKPEDVVDENDENDAAVKENKKKATKSVEVGGGEKIYQKLEPMKKSEKETINQHKEKRNKKRDFDMALAKFEEKYGSISPTADGGEVGGDGQNQRGPGKGKGRGRGRQSRNNNGSDPAGPSTSHSSSTTNKQGAEFTPENDN